MELTRSNLEEWKKEYDKLFLEKTEMNTSISEVMSDEKIMDMYEGISPEDALDEELSYWVD